MAIPVEKTYSHVFNSPAEGIPLEIFDAARSGKKLRVMGLLGGERSLMIYLAVETQDQRASDRRTDRQNCYSYYVRQHY